MTLSNRYAALKKKVGGNREIRRYEDTFGQPFEEGVGITAPSRMNRRILSEIEFSIALSDSLEGKYDELIDKALGFLEKKMDEDGVLTNAACIEAESILYSLKDDAKEYKLILAGHAHIDMNWMWSWHETVAAALATFRTMLQIMDEYPEFCFSQSQGAVYKIVEDYEPELMEKIKARISEGRWEVTSSAWVETDKNMPSTESLIKHIIYTKNYMRDNWGIDPDSIEVDFSPDTFGHSANLPEIDLNGGVKYYYHCRGLNGNQALYRWVSPSGKEMLCYREQHWYNSGITPKIGLAIFDIAKRSGGLKTGLVVYGVGDHGGGPTRRDVETAIELSEWPIYPTVKFGTISEFFHEAESVRENLPLVDHEMNMMFPGCYTTQSRIKMGNRMCEAAFADAENLGAVANLLTGKKYKGALLEEKYRSVLFTHFHDILTGSCVQDSREHAMGLYSEAIAYANNEYLSSMNAISSATDTSMIVTETDPLSRSESAGAGYGYDSFAGKPIAGSGNGLTRIFTVFNPTPVDKEENVIITVWDWPGDLHRADLRNISGDKIDFQLLNFRPEEYWDHKFFRFAAYVKVKALGYTTLVLKEAEIEGLYPVYIRTTSSSSQPTSNIVLDNGVIRAEFDYMTAALVSLKDLESEKEFIKDGSFASFVLIDTERDSSNAWNIGKYQSVTPVTRITRIRRGGGKLINSMHFEATVLDSTITADISLAKGARHLSIKTEIDWNERGKDHVPVLAFALPLSYTADKYMYDNPAGVICREAMDIDVPGLTFGAAVAEEGRGAVIINDCKYGYRARKDGTLISTLINSSVSPDKYPERGIHKLTLSIALIDGAPKNVVEYACSVCRPLTYVPASSHKGCLPAESAPVVYSGDGILLSSLSVCGDGSGFILRAYSVSDRQSVFCLNTGKAIKSACAVDYFERVVESDLSVSGDTLRVSVMPKTIVTLKICF